MAANHPQQAMCEVHLTANEEVPATALRDRLWEDGSLDKNVALCDTCLADDEQHNPWVYMVPEEQST
jgi:hypothetical protein